MDGEPLTIQPNRPCNLSRPRLFLIIETRKQANDHLRPLHHLRPSLVFFYCYAFSFRILSLYQSRGLTAFSAYAILNHRKRGEQQMTRQRIELIGKVNKIRAIEKRPSKTIVAAQTLSRAVIKAFLACEAGKTK